MTKEVIMPRAIWSGSISFGLVNIPVKLVVAVRDKTVRFHKLHASDGVRLHQKMFCPADGEEVDDEDTVRGYEISSGAYVVVRQEELDALAPKASRTIEITDFVDQSEIDPVYYDRPYYVIPDEQAAKAYSLLVKVMSDASKVGIAKVVMHNKEYLVALRPLGGVLCLETMRFGDEVMPTEDLEEKAPELKVEDRQLGLARQLVDMLSSTFEPGKYHDEYREAVLEMVERKAEGEEVLLPSVEVEEPGKVIDLMAALESSLARAGGGKRSGAGARRAAKKQFAKKTGKVVKAKAAGAAAAQRRRRAG
jgi:DNA end-binding protein Ku